ncbi:MFS general substrate transporter [Sordaria brevicollis]|uniref:MFS general substrate transporter n=1 Tax=Sordaria brevicollis TaxID=83679 RepID=A0AAE0PDA8_SORBR|nr:MFS general substrate transporter [Sordaria brevicollis]
MTLGPDSPTATAPSHQGAGFPPSDQKFQDGGRAAHGTESKSLSDESPAEDSDAVQEVEFKEGGYGWVVVFGVWLVNMHTWGLNSSYAVFLAYYLRSGTIIGASPLFFAFIGGLSVSIALLVSPAATHSIKTLGTRVTLFIGVIFETGSFIAASFSDHAWQLLLSQGVCFGLGLGFCFTATVGVVPQWFTKRRSFANALATGGSGFGGLTYALGANAMITNLGLEWAFRILAIICFVVNGSVCLIMKDRNKAVGAKHIPFHKDLFFQPEYWLFVGWGFFGIIGYIIVVFSIADYALQAGFTSEQASLASAMFNLSQALGRPAIGLLSDRLGRMNVAGIGTLIASVVAFFLWIFAGKYYAGLIIYALFGAVAGILWPCVGPVAAEVVGLQLLPAGNQKRLTPWGCIALSVYWIILVFPSTFAEVIGLSLKRETIGATVYLDVQVFTGFMFFASFLSMWLLRSWKLRQMESLGLDEKEQEAAIHNAAAVRPSEERKRGSASNTRQQNVVVSYVTNMFVMKRL